MNMAKRFLLTALSLLMALLGTAAKPDRDIELLRNRFKALLT